MEHGRCIDKGGGDWGMYDTVLWATPGAYHGLLDGLRRLFQVFAFGCSYGIWDNDSPQTCRLSGVYILNISIQSKRKQEPALCTQLRE